MGKTVIVMRHGKAKRPADGQADIERELTEAGRRSLAATLGGSLRLWPAGDSRTEIWTSPAIRAQQTAELLARSLRKRGVSMEREPRIVESLWTGDAETLLDEIRSSSADTIALVGHNPFAEEFVRSLTGSSINFSTGACAAISLADELKPDNATGGNDAVGMSPERIDSSADDEPPARLLWFVQGPVSQRWKTLVSMEKTLGEAAENIQRKFDAFLGNPDDIETMHALRVSIRTARSLAAFVRPWHNGAHNDRIQEDLKAVVRLTSRLRELDVMWEQVQADNSFSHELASFCADHAAEERYRVCRALSEDKTRKRLARAIDNLSAIRWKRRIAESGLEPAEIRTRFAKMASELKADLDTLDLADIERTHDVRKQAKRVRYSAERFKDILGADAVSVAKNMVSHQDELGAICDARVNIDIINSLTAGNLDEPVAWELALLRAKYETFLYTALRASRESR